MYTYFYCYDKLPTLVGINHRVQLLSICAFTSISELSSGPLLWSKNSRSVYTFWLHIRNTAGVDQIKTPLNHRLIKFNMKVNQDFPTLVSQDNTS